MIYAGIARTHYLAQAPDHGDLRKSLRTGQPNPPRANHLPEFRKTYMSTSAQIGRFAPESIDSPDFRTQDAPYARAYPERHPG